MTSSSPPRTAHQAKTAQIEQFQHAAVACCELLEDANFSDEKRTGIAEDLEEFGVAIQKFGTVEMAYLTASQKQRELAEGFFAKNWDIIAAVGGNRSGKSWWAIVMCAARWIAEVARDGALVWFVSQNARKSAGGVQKVIWESLDQSRFSRTWKPEGGFVGQGVVTYRTDDGGHATIQFKNEEQELNTFESDPVSLVIWDEASKESILNRLAARILDKSGQILIATLPEHLWLQMRIQASPNPRTHFAQFSTWDNESNLPPGAIERFAANLTPEARRMRIEGEFVGLKGLAIPEFRPLLHPAGHILDTAHMLKHSRKNWPWWLYIDVGLYTAAMLFTVMPNGTLVVWDEVYNYNERVERNVADILAMLDREQDLGLTDQLHRLVSLRSDKKRSEEVDSDESIEKAVSRLQRGIERFEGLMGVFMDPYAWHRSPVSEAVLAEVYEDCGLAPNRWTRVKAKVGEKAFIQRARGYFARDNIKILDRAENAIRELGSWRWKMDQDQKIDLAEKLEATDNHTVDCLMAWTWERPTHDVDEVGVHFGGDDADSDDGFSRL